MSLILKNQRIYDFYQKNTQYDFEKMNHFIIDLLEGFTEKVSPSLDQTFASNIMKQMVDLQTQLLKQQQEQQIDHYKQLTDFRKQYHEELQHAIHYNHTEKVQPLIAQQVDQFIDKMDRWQKDHPVWKEACDSLKLDLQKDIVELSRISVTEETLKEFTQNVDERLIQSLSNNQTLVNNMLTASEGRIHENMREQTRKLDNIGETTKDQEQMHSQVSDLLRKMDNSSSKGKVSETMLNHVVHNLYPMGEIKAVGTTKETGDIIMLRENKPTILFENKNYERNVGQEEVQKFLRDVETQQCAGILLAQNYGIANKSNYEIHLYQGKVCVYIHQVNYSPEKIKIAVDIIDHLSQYIDDSGFQNEEIVLDKEFLEQLNKEYQAFVLSKTNQIKLVKEYTQKLLAQIDEMKMPQLEQWLGKYFSQSLTKENQCNIVDLKQKALVV